MDILKDITLIQPEVVLSVGILASLIVEILTQRPVKWLVPIFSIIVLAITGFYVITNLYNGGEPFKMLFVSPLNRMFDLVIILGAIITTLLAWDRDGEHHFLILSAVLGAMVLVKSVNFISFILALELFSFAVVGQIALSRDTFGTEAGLKFLFLSVLASTLIIMGVALLYSIFGTFDFKGIFIQTLINPIFQAKPLLFVLAFTLIFVGLAFKLSAVPFHFWTPEVFQGAHSSVGGFISTVSKASAFGFLVNLLYLLFGNIPYVWGEILMWMGAITMFLGNLAALAEKDIKRLLGFSTIAHAGYIMTAFGLGTTGAISGAIFYLLVYTLMTLGAFAVVNSVDERKTSLEYYKGLSKRNGLQAFLLLIFFVSLAGVPPTAGFVAKFYLFQELVREGEFFFAIWAFLNGVISLFYYSRPIFYAYGFEPRYEVKGVLNPAVALAFVLGFVGVLYLGLAPSFVLDFIRGIFNP
ncbi:MAG: NADH-quinone oxidoreductase subunit N [Candidatus Caldipriscus sp.]|nr:NADH-quinone oxidoreductase subunit N [Candidatus Caldipriscus sp.]